MLQRGWGVLGRMEKGLRYKPKVGLVSKETELLVKIQD